LSLSLLSLRYLHSFPTRRSSDLYSELLTPKDLKQFNSRTGGRYGGLGMLIAEDQQTHLINVETVYPNTPAEAGGVREGDKIVKVDRKSTRLNSSHQIISYAVFCL